MAREAERRIQEGVTTSIPAYAERDPERVTTEAIHKGAQEGNGVARSLIEHTGYYLGVGLANLINLFNPELILIGGSLSNIGDMLLEPAFQEAGRRAFRRSYGAVCLTWAGAEFGGPRRCGLCQGGKWEEIRGP